MSAGIEALLARRLLLVTGKGGVGRSVVSAALALAALRRGQRVLLLEANPGAQARAEALLDRGPVGTGLTDLEPRLWAASMDPRAALREYITLKFRFRFVYDRAFDNRFARAFLRAVPGMDDLLLLGKALHHVRERDRRTRAPRFDLVVLDAPATGHGVPFLKLPQVILEAVRVGPMRKEALWMQGLLEDPAITAMVLVALPEELPARETIELHRLARKELRLSQGALVINRMLPPPFPDAASRLFRTVAGCARRSCPEARGLIAAATLAGEIRTEQARERKRLRQEVRLPTFELPELGVGELGRSELELLVRHLESGRGR